MKTLLAIIALVVYNVICSPTYVNITIGLDVTFPSDSETFYGVVTVPAQNIFRFLASPFKDGRKIYARLNAPATEKNHDWDLSEQYSIAGFRPTLTERTIHVTILETVGHPQLKIGTFGVYQNATEMPYNAQASLASDSLYYMNVPAGDSFVFYAKGVTGWAGIGDAYDWNKKVPTPLDTSVVYIDNSKKGGIMYFSTQKDKTILIQSTNQKPVVKLSESATRRPTLVANTVEDFHFTLEVAESSFSEIRFDTLSESKLVCSSGPHSFTYDRKNPAALLFVPYSDVSVSWECALRLYEGSSVMTALGSSNKIEINKLDHVGNVVVPVAKSTNYIYHYYSFTVPSQKKLYVKVYTDHLKAAITQTVTYYERGSIASTQFDDKSFVGKEGITYDFVVQTLTNADTEYSIITSDQPIVDKDDRWILYVVAGCVGGFVLLIILTIAVVLIIACVIRARKPEEQYGSLSGQQQRYYQ
ncbi:1 TM domain-containing transmembrane protein [Acrasis kona]|uniref:1 TM domain-containing transmembrane protein n=1 Tax=Acrasis kona TaxID=1008807 RepID=A0AAW2ZCR9_9EUKA